jgi:cation:H+ antiporter
MLTQLLHLLIDENALHESLILLSTPALLGIIVATILTLSKGADWMIEGVVALARRTGLPRIVIGATIVSLGTTMPEAFVSVMAAFMGDPGLALGNGVGSIIADTGLIFGVTALVARVPADRFILNRTGWVQLAAAVLLVLVATVARLGSEGEPVLGRWVGVLFLSLLLLYLYKAYAWAREHSPGGEASDEEGELPSLLRSFVEIGGGIALVIVSARVLVPGAAVVAARFGVPNDVIAATMVAFGTSLPELVTALAAVRKGHPEIAVGNVVGADVLNCLFVIGAAACASPLQIPPTFYSFHFPAMLAILISFRVFSIRAAGRSFSRWHGGWLLSLYLVYITVQFVATHQ